MKDVARVLFAAACLAGGLTAGCAGGGSERALDERHRAEAHGRRDARNGTTTSVFTGSNGSTTTCITTAGGGICRGSVVLIEGVLRSQAGTRSRNSRVRTRMVRAKVVEWNDDEGWGVLSSPEIASEGIWAHFSAIDMEGYKTLVPGRFVMAHVEGPLAFEQDRYRYRAVSVWPVA